MDRDGGMRWGAEYERAWRPGDLSGVPRFFSPEAHYRTSPYAEPKVGSAAIQAFCRDRWVLRFAPGGRVETWEEWAYWPSKPYSAGSAAAGQ